MKLADTVLGMLRHGAGATLVLAIGCGSAAGPELHAIGSKPADAPVRAAGSAPTAVLVPVPTMDPFAPQFVSPPPAPTPAPPVVTVATTEPRRPRRPRRPLIRRPDIRFTHPACGRG